MRFKANITRSSADVFVWMHELRWGKCMLTKLFGNYKIAVPDQQDK